MLLKELYRTAITRTSKMAAWLPELGDAGTRDALKSGLDVLAVPPPQELSPIGWFNRAIMVFRVGTVFHTPSIPFTECVIGPIPAVFLKYVNTIPQILISTVTRSPPDGTEFPNVNMDVELLLKFYDGTQCLFESLPVVPPAVDCSRVNDPCRVIVNTLMRKTVGYVHMNTINHARNIDRFQ